MNISNVNPTLKDLLDQLRKEIFLGLNCHAVATIQSFDKEKQTVTATINYKKTIIRRKQNGKYEPQYLDYPLLADCPAIVMRGGAFSLKMPIKKGDECLLLFNDRDFDNWFAGNSNKGTKTPRLHSFSDALALVGVSSLSTVLSGYEDDKAILGDGTHDLILGSGEASLKSGESSVEVKEKISLKNASQNLGGLLQDLITVIKSITTTNAAVGAPCAISAASQAQLTQVATKLQGLLE